MWKFFLLLITDQPTTFINLFLAENPYLSYFKKTIGYLITESVSIIALFNGNNPYATRTAEL